MQKSPVLNPDWLMEIRWFVLCNLFSYSKGGIIRVIFIIEKLFGIDQYALGDTWESLIILDILV